MPEVVLTLPAVAFVVYDILKGWYAQAALIMTGFALLTGVDWLADRPMNGGQKGFATAGNDDKGR